MEAIPLMKATILALIPFLAYIMLRSIIDAVEVRAVNTVNLYASFGISILVSLVLAKTGLKTLGLAIGSTIGFIVLGILTVYYLWRLYKFDMGPFKIKICLLINIILIAIAYVIKTMFTEYYGGVYLIFIGIITEVILFVMYYIALRYLNIRWVWELESRFIKATI
jgi:hypothetical protein